MASKSAEQLGTREPTTFGDMYGVGFERTVLWILLNTPDTFHTTSFVNEELFDKPEARVVIHHVDAYLKKYKRLPKRLHVVADVKSAQKRLAANAPRRKEYSSALRYLLQIKNAAAPTQGEVEFARDAISKFVMSRSIHRALIKSGEHWARGDFDDAVRVVQRAYDEAKRVDVTDLGLNFKDTAAKMIAYRKRLRTTRHCPLDIPILDSVMRGGLEPGTLGMFIAPTGRGKTLAMIHAGSAALLQGLSVVHATLEISALDTAYRYDARLAGIPINEIAMNPLRHRKKIRATARKLTGNLFIQEWGSSEASIHDIRTYLNVLKSTASVMPDVLLVDYADLIRVPKTKAGGDARRWDLGEIIRELRQMARDFNCAVWTASQTGRASFTSNMVKLEDVWECLEKVQVADVVIGMCQSKQEKKRGQMRMALLKNRLGGKEGTVVDCVVVSDTQLLREAQTQTSGLGTRHSF